MPRWKAKRVRVEPEKAKKASGVARKKHVMSDKPRKKRTTVSMPIPPKGDWKSLADNRKGFSVKKLSDRLQILSDKDFEAYAARSKISVRHARRDRGPHPHANRLTEEQKKKVVKHWTGMTKKCNTKIGRKNCTQHRLATYLLKVEKLFVSRSALSRLLIERAHGAKKRAPPYVHQNEHDFMTNRNRT